MIKWAMKLYAVIALLAPWIFLVLRLSGYYNFPTRNTWIFLGLFVLSIVTIFFVYDDKTEN